ncbi:MAG: hypothetical protein PSV17_10010 [Methylotenera sp.]|uniref:DUF7931 domain-containing protein n=1 Tax=Methylotenera sp. TaxID=2051956 RepID=UPI002488FC9C|nr:hypothetical protein [Methylotenera sp.]MDI1309750.1 hypothetical protein [Methylotenera sp.]
MTINNINIELTPDQVIVGEHLYAEAINLILATAEHELLIFDQDLSHGDFASKQKHELFQQFLNKSPSNQLTIVLQDTGFFQNKCPRLLDLLTIYGHKMTVYETNQTAKHAKDCFILADDKHYVKRIHIDQARFRYSLDDLATASLLNTRFKELLEATQDVVTISRLGL